MISHTTGIPTYVISLEREQERRRNINSTMKLLGLPFEHFDAFNGSCLHKYKAYAGLLATETVQRKHIKRSLIPNEVGCFISHLQLWQNIVASSTPYTCILESDAKPTSGLALVFEHIANSKFKGDLLMLNYSKCWPSYFGKSKISPHYSIVRFANPRTYYTSGYILSLNGARQLLKLVKNHKICMPVDDFLTGGRIPKTLNTYATFPRTVELSELATYSVINGKPIQQPEIKRSGIRLALRKLRIRVHRLKSYKSL